MPFNHRKKTGFWIALTVFSFFFLATLAATVWRPDFLSALVLIPPWLWLIAGILSTIPLVRRAPVWLMLLCLGCWLVYGIVTVEETSALMRLGVGKVRNFTSTPVKFLRIVTLNCANSQQCLEDLKSVEPDIILLQEAPGKEQLERMAVRLFSETGRVVVASDQAILVRSQADVQILDSGDSDIIALLSVGGQQLCCASLRLTPPPSRLDFWRPEFWIAHQELRNRHRAELSFLMKQLEQTADGLPVIVGGDMNAVPQDRAFDVLRSRLQDSFDRSGLGWGATGTNEWPLFRVDQIWTGSQVHSIRTWAKKTKCSDHRMVICDFILQ